VYWYHSNLNGLGNTALDMLRLKIYVSAIIGATNFKMLALIWSDPVDLDKAWS